MNQRAKRQKPASPRQGSRPVRASSHVLPVEKPSVSLLWSGAAAGLFMLFLTALPSPLPVVNPAIYQRTAEARWNQMIGTIAGGIDSYHGDVGVYLKDLKTGRVYEHLADHSFVSASLIKLPIMVAVFQAIRDGRLALHTRIRYHRRDRRSGSGRLKFARAGGYFPVSFLVYKMMTLSDNTATAMLIQQLGYDYLNDVFMKVGLTETRINPTGMSLASRVNPLYDNYTTPREMGLLLEKIYRHELVSDGFSDMMLDIMKSVNSHNRLARNLPPSWQLAHKTGLLRKNCHDVGIVFTPEGDNYILCVLTGENHNYRMAKHMIERLGQLAYEYMGNS